MKFDRRSEAREPIRLPVSFDGGGVGLTGDISPSGLFVEFDGRPERDSAIAFCITLADEGRPFRLRAQGQVVWVQQRGGRSGVGVRILTSTLETVSLDACVNFIH